MYFASDNWSGAHDAILEAIKANSAGFKGGYNTGELDRKVEEKLSEIFETEVSAFFVATGTAANSIALALSAKPGSVAFAHEEAHVMVDECGAPEFFSSARLHGVSGQHGKIDPHALKTGIAKFPKSFLHHGRPGSLTLTQATELGTVYKRDEIEQLVDIARHHDMPVHMDGARFANAVVSLNTSPADITWRAGVDMLSFGGTKNGCWCAEAILCFRAEWREELAFHHKRAGQLFSKSRFIAAQFDAYLADDLWLKMARHANAMNQRLADILRASDHFRLAMQPDANETFAIADRKIAQRLQDDGVIFFEWALPASHSEWLNGDSEALYRFVCSFATTDAHLADLERSLAKIDRA